MDAALALKHRRCRGFTLVEAVCALAVLGVAVGGIMAMLAGEVRRGRSLGTGDEISRLVRGEMERLRVEGWGADDTREWEVDLGAERIARVHGRREVVCLGIGVIDDGAAEVGSGPCPLERSVVRYELLATAGGESATYRLVVRP